MKAKTKTAMDFKMILTAMLIGGFFVEYTLVALGIK